MECPKLLDEETGKYFAYQKLQGTRRVSIVYFGGFQHTMKTTKVIAIHKFCQEKDVTFVMFDYLGRGESDGGFDEFTITDWKRNCASVVSELTTGDLILVGSSMGGWLMLLIALQFPRRVKALIGVAAAPDFTEELLVKAMSEAQRKELKTEGVTLHHSFKITKELIEEGKKNCIMNRQIYISCPIRLLHSLNDEVVPYETALRIAQRVTSSDVQVQLMKSSNHIMTDPRALQVLLKTIDEFL